MNYRLYIRFAEGHGRWGSGAYTTLPDVREAAKAEAIHWSVNTRIEVWESGKNPHRMKYLFTIAGSLPRLPHADE
jgi:hypothetical protein